MLENAIASNELPQFPFTDVCMKVVDKMCVAYINSAEKQLIHADVMLEYQQCPDIKEINTLLVHKKEPIVVRFAIYWPSPERVNVLPAMRHQNTLDHWLNCTEELITSGLVKFKTVNSCGYDEGDGEIYHSATRQSSILHDKKFRLAIKYPEYLTYYIPNWSISDNKKILQIIHKHDVAEYATIINAKVGDWIAIDQNSLIVNLAETSLTVINDSSVHRIYA